MRLETKIWLLVEESHQLPALAVGRKVSYKE